MIDPTDNSTINWIDRQELDQLEVDWCAPSSFPDLTNCESMAIDLETRDPNIMTLGPGWVRGDGYVVGIAVATGDFNGYFPMRHEGGGNLAPNAVLKWFKKQVETPHITKIFHNATYDLGWLLHEGIKVQGPIVDTMIAAPLLDENRYTYSLNSLGYDYLGSTKSEKMLRIAAKDWGIDPKADMWRLPAKYVGQYAEQDAALTFKLWNRLWAEIQKNELVSIFELESSLTPLLLEMRSRGVRVDLDKAEQTKLILAEREKDIVNEIKRDTGIVVEPWVATSVASVLDYYGLDCPKTDNTKQPSITKAFLQACPHEVAAKVLKLRELNKANSTFIDSILRYTKDGRINCEFNQLRSDDGGTVTGRFSSSNPNLQQIPARDPEIKSMIRGLFVPEEGEQWGSFDYSSQEPRLLVHYCSILSDYNPNPGVQEIVDAYQNGDVDFHQMVADMAGISRKQAKTVNLGIMYGMGQGKLANTLDITKDEAKALLDTYHSKVPFVKGLADMVSARASKHGQVRTLLGRKCRFDLWEPNSFGYNKPLKHEEAIKEYGPGIRRAFTYKALNKLIQGSAADQTKKAMADCFAEGLIPLLTVHDELCFSISSEDQASRIKEIMETCVPLRVPSKVDQELGENWGEVG
jgi:DNA polymerase I-like protein with 3'-5' exonuclease and polymerase domains